MLRNRIHPLFPSTFSLFISALAFLSPPADYVSPYFEFQARLMDAGHYVVFFLLSVVLFHCAPLNKLNRGKRFVAVLAFAVGYAGLIELIQPSFGREASWIDFLNGTLGVTSALLAIYFFHQLQQRKLSVQTGSCIALVLLCSAAFTLYPSYLAFQALRFQAHLFPKLGNFENPAELHFWIPGNEFTEVSLSEKKAPNGAPTLHFTAPDPALPTLLYKANFFNWSTYESFAFSVFSEDSSKKLHIRIDDNKDCTEFDQRFNKTFLLSAGWNEIRIPLEEIESAPLGRKLETASIFRVIFFSPSPEQSIFLANVRLE